MHRPVALDPEEPPTAGDPHAGQARAAVELSVPVAEQKNVRSTYEPRLKRRPLRDTRTLALAGVRFMSLSLPSKPT